MITNNRRRKCQGPRCVDCGGISGTALWTYSPTLYCHTAGTSANGEIYASTKKAGKKRRGTMGDWLFAKSSWSLLFFFEETHPPHVMTKIGRQVPARTFWNLPTDILSVDQCHPLWALRPSRRRDRKAVLPQLSRHLLATQLTVPDPRW